MMTLYEPETVFIARDGRTVTGHAEIAARSVQVEGRDSSPGVNPDA